MGQIPILQVGPVLLVSVQVELHDRVAEELQDDILARLRDSGSQAVLIDITALETVDSFIGRVLSQTARMAGVMGARVVLVGLQPEVTMALLELGLDLPGIEFGGDIDAGISLLGYELVERQAKAVGERAG